MTQTRIFLLTGRNGWSRLCTIWKPPRNLHSGWFPANGAPDWVLRIWLEVLKLLLPKVELHGGEQSAVESLGAMLGHQQRMLTDEGVWETQAKKLEEIDDRLRSRLGAKGYRQLLKRTQKARADVARMAEQGEKVMELKKAVIKEALSVVSGRPVEEQREFNRAYSQALDTDIYDTDGNLRYEKLSSTTAIYFLLAVNWRSLTHFGSVPVLHRWLCSVLGRSQVGQEIDRVKGIC